MERLKIGELVKATGGKLISGSEENCITAITTDSRQAKEGSLFIALKGDKFDGNDFAADFLKQGAGAVVSRPVEAPGKDVILVEDTKAALRNVASMYRDKFDIPVVAVTGSVGKTSTKDMVASVLSQHFDTLKTQGNFNNEIGLPLTVLNLNSQHRMAVIEMGMNNFGEISRLTAIAKPSVAIITNIGTAHIGNLGSQQNILKAKLEILEKLKPGGPVILNGDDKILWSLKGKLPHPVIYYGIDNMKADIVATDLIIGIDKSKFKVHLKGEEYSFVINAIGQHHIYNALAAILTGIYYKMDVQDIINGVAAFSSGKMRQDIQTYGQTRLIEDCYNASKDSMVSALRVLSQIGGTGRTIAVLGDILEQGEFSEKMHREVGAAVVENGIKKLVTVGPDSRFVADEAHKLGMEDIKIFKNNQDAIEYLLQDIAPGDTVLFKASRGMKLEQVSTAVKDHLSQQSFEF